MKEEVTNFLQDKPKTNAFPWFISSCFKDAYISYNGRELRFHTSHCSDGEIWQNYLVSSVMTDIVAGRRKLLTEAEAKKLVAPGKIFGYTVNKCDHGVIKIGCETISTNSLQDACKLLSTLANDRGYFYVDKQGISLGDETATWQDILKWAE